MPSILLVDDDRDFLYTMREFFEFSKFVVETSMDGNEALEALTYGNFDLALMDWTLPGLGGIEVCRQYRVAGGKIPIMILTGNEGASYREASKEAGVTDFLTKPFDLRRLLARIESAIAQAKETQTS